MSETPCQDAVLARVNGPVLRIVLADGAGSAKHARLGARLACKAVMSELIPSVVSSLGRNHLIEYLLGSLDASASQLAMLAARRGIDQTEFASTLIALVATPTQVAAVHVGDGATIIRNAKGLTRVLTEPHHGIFANETFFLTDADWRNNVRSVVIRDRITAVIAMSDGLEHLALERTPRSDKDSVCTVPFRPFVEPLIGIASRSHRDATNAVHSLLGSESLRRHTDDDCALAVAVRRA
ncbi:MAG: protein phosphatase 2C domain-containing protein [Pirellulales bacterium]|nr:protein phosphatase 2C domain-containing protein [Pirellulales bacterium]